MAGELGLSFANNETGSVPLRCNTFIAVMKPAELQNRDNLSHARGLPRKRTLLTEPQVGPRLVVVPEIRRQRPLQMLGTEDHEVVQAFSADRAD